MKNCIPLFAAIISAAVLLFGYLFQKIKEREAEIRKKRQEIYSRFIVNLTERQELFDQARDDPTGLRERMSITPKKSQILSLKTPSLIRVLLRAGK